MTVEAADLSGSWRWCKTINIVCLPLYRMVAEFKGDCNFEGASTPSNYGAASGSISISIFVSVSISIVPLSAFSAVTRAWFGLGSFLSVILIQLPKYTYITTRLFSSSATRVTTQWLTLYQQMTPFGVVRFLCSDFGRILSVGAISFDDRFCASRKGGTGGSRWVLRFTV